MPLSLPLLLCFAVGSGEALPSIERRTLGEAGLDAFGDAACIGKVRQKKKKKKKQRQEKLSASRHNFRSIYLPPPQGNQCSDTVVCPKVPAFLVR